MREIPGKSKVELDKNKINDGRDSVTKKTPQDENKIINESEFDRNNEGNLDLGITTNTKSEISEDDFDEKPIILGDNVVNNSNNKIKCNEVNQSYFQEQVNTGYSDKKEGNLGLEESFFEDNRLETGNNKDNAKLHQSNNEDIVSMSEGTEKFNEATDDVTKTTSDLLEKSTCNFDELCKYLKQEDLYYGTNYADEFMESANWPNEIQVPKDSSVLDSEGKIDWKQVPQGGYVLDDSGEAIKKEYVPYVGEIIDRYGPTDGRYTCPVVDGKPYGYEKRSLPHVEDISKYHQYKVIGDFKNIKSYIDDCKDLELKADVEAYMKLYNITEKELIVEKGEIAPGFGENGGGVQYKLPLPVDILVDLGLLDIV